MSDTVAHVSVVLDAENPWPGLHEFDERDRDFFNGRDSESAELARQVRDAALTVLFGGSGLGKTSLLRAGLIPKLPEEHYLPIYLRIDPRDKELPLIEQAAAALRAQLATRKVEHPPFPEGEPLWEYLHRSGLEFWSAQNHLLTPVFIIDQLEEVFTLGAENHDAVRKFRDELADLIENRVPGSLAVCLEQAEFPLGKFNLQARNYKFLLSFREDFLPDFEAWRSTIPAMMRNRLRLLPMDGEKALEAVSKTGGKLVSNDVANAIVQFVAVGGLELEDHRPSTPPSLDAPALLLHNQALEAQMIEPSLLSLVCTGLNERRKKAGKTVIDQDLLCGTGRAIVAEFYDECVKDLAPGTRQFIETELITEGGHRNPYPKEDAIAQGYITDAELDTLVKRRLLRVEPHLGADRIELIHDLLTTVVRQFRDQERLRQRRANERKMEKKRRQYWAAAGAAVLATIVLIAVLGIVLRNEALNRAIANRQRAVAQAIDQRYDEALHLLEGSLATYQRWGEDGSSASTYVEIGKVLIRQGALDEARRNFERALDLARQTGSGSLEGEALESLASLEEKEGNGDKALELYSKALGRYVPSGAVNASARILERLADEASEQGRKADAAKRYRESLAYYAIAGDWLSMKRVKRLLEPLSAWAPVWGYLLDIRRGLRHPMRSDSISIGRDTLEDGIRNDVSFGSNFVSRRHLNINREGFQADDLRSLNGTTINGTVLPYGTGVNLADGDVITLANVEALQFTTKDVEPTQPPSSAWAIFIGGDRFYQYLTGPEYSVVMNNSTLRIEEGNVKPSLLKLRWADNKYEMFDMQDRWTLVYWMKENDYNYSGGIAPTGAWMEWVGMPFTYVQLSDDGKTTQKNGPTFQAILMESRR